MSEGDFILFRDGFLPTNNLNLTTEEWAHFRARRLNKEDHIIEIRDGLGKCFEYLFSPNKKELSFLKERELPKRKILHTIAMALPKGNRLDFFLQKVTEIGISRVIFCELEHSIRKEFNLDRAKKIVSEAASQSKQPDLLKIEIVVGKDWISQVKENLLVLDPHAKTKYQRNDLKGKIPLIGPEGGFSKTEISLMDSLSVKRVRWDGGILRTETAGIVAASLLAYGF